MKGHAHQHTIYSYKLLYRFRWGLIGYLLQLVLIGLSLIGSSMLLQVPVASLVVTLAILPVVPICHLFIFRLYARLRSQKPRTTADMLVSPWWGPGTCFPCRCPFIGPASARCCSAASSLRPERTSGFRPTTGLLCSAVS